MLNQSHVKSNRTKKRGLTALLVAQFMGAANDNILKTLLSFAVVRGMWGGELGEGGQGLVALAFLFRLFSFRVGQDHLRIEFQSERSRSG